MSSIMCNCAQLPSSLGGFNTDNDNPVTCVYIDTEGTFVPKELYPRPIVLEKT